MFTSLALATLLLAPHSSVAASQPKFAKPSEASVFVNQPMEGWKAAIHAGEWPKTRVAPKDEVQRRAKKWCPVFSVESQSGEELYFLALICRDAVDWQKARSAIEYYLAESQQAHAPEARVLLAIFENSERERDKSWQLLHTVLEKDPMDNNKNALMDTVIEDEADKDDSKALGWAEERYSLLVDRAKSQTANTPPISYQWVVFAGVDLVHRYYLSGKDDRAHQVLIELNGFTEAHPGDIGRWPSEILQWANMEMHPASAIPIRKLLAGEPLSELIQEGRVEVISFFFLGCEPCMRELPDLNDLQKRYPTKNVLVADVTTYEANAFVDPATPTKIEAALNRTRQKKASDLSMVVTSEEALANYGIGGFPSIAVIDKCGRVRYLGHAIDFEEDEPVARLIRKLVEEQVDVSAAFGPTGPTGP